MAEALGFEQFRERVKIFATDIDEEALNQARLGSYCSKEVTGLPEEYLKKYFDLINNRYVFRKELRRSIIFGRNNLVQDAPISRIDLLACRNALMYFNAETQAKILKRFHFALNNGGILFLGKAETAHPQPQLCASGFKTAYLYASAKRKFAGALVAFGPSRNCRYIKLSFYSGAYA